MNRTRFLLATLAVVFSLGNISAQIPRGVFSLKGAGGKALPAAVANPDVVGLSIRQDWADLEPKEGEFAWDYLEREVNKATGAGKIVLLRINTQANKPAWVTQAVLDAGGTFFNFVDGTVPTTIPVFWDPTYLQKKKNMIAQLGAHFADYPTAQNRAVKIVSASFANSKSEDWSVPHATSDVDEWHTLEYTTAKMVDAGQQILDATMAAFPTQQVTLAIGGNGSLDATPIEVAANTIALTRAKWPGRLIAQINSLSTHNPVAPGLPDTTWNLLWKSQPDVGSQMLDNVYGDVTCRVNNYICGVPDLTVLSECVDSAVCYGINFIEIYETDVINLPAAVTYARQKLAPTPTPSPTPVPFHLDGEADAVGYLQPSDGMPIYAAVRGGILYLATSSPGNDAEPNDKFIFVTDTLLGSALAPSPWSKLGMIATDGSKPFVGGESLSDFCGWFNAPTSSLAMKSATGSGVMEATLDLVAAFGSIPETVYVAAGAYETADAGTLVAQGPFGNGDGNIDPDEFLPLSIAALTDENADGTYDRLDPTRGFVVQKITRADGVVTVSWAAEPGKTYQVYVCNQLGDAWAPLGEPVAAGPGQLYLSQVDQSDLPARFYRVQLATP